MNLHFLRGKWWPIVFPPSCASVTSRRDFIVRAVRSLLTELTYPHFFTGLPLVHLMQFPRGLPNMYTISELLTDNIKYCLWNNSYALLDYIWLRARLNKFEMFVEH